MKNDLKHQHVNLMQSRERSWRVGELKDVKHSWALSLGSLIPKIRMRIIVALPISKRCCENELKQCVGKLFPNLKNTVSMQ